MKIDQEIFKTIFGREYDGNDEKDKSATISLHYWLNVLGVWSETRDYGYVLTYRGLLSCQCMQDILQQWDDLHGNQFSETTINTLALLEIALESTAEILNKTFDDRDAIISAAAYKYIKTEYHLDREEDEKKRKLEFEKRFSAGDYELGKTCSEQAEILYNSVIESETNNSLQNNSKAK